MGLKILGILLIISFIINILFVFIIIRQKKKFIRGNESNILKEILNKVSQNELNFVDSSARYIIEVLQKYYKIDYCTIFMGKEENIKVIASNVDPYYQEDVKEYCKGLSKRKRNSAIISESEKYLDYKSATKRHIRFSYFITLGNIGALYIENEKNYEDNDFEVDFFNLVIKNIGIILQNCIYQDEISKMAMRDNLTNMYNRNYMMKHLNIITKKEEEVVLGIMDIDHFKSINDTYGHDFGDIVLKEVSKFIKDNLSTMDEIYRWGGEEFILSFPGQSLKDVEFKLNTIREALSRKEITNGENTIKITASFGAAELLKGLSIDEVIKRADKALYSSKSNGRNRVTVYQ